PFGLAPIACCLLGRPSPRSPRFPYATLFRSGPHGVPAGAPHSIQARPDGLWQSWSRTPPIQHSGCDPVSSAVIVGLPSDCQALRSEEHTSELQSRENLVCRLLLEKKTRLQEP